jgi:hypothetical protein
MNKYPEFMEAVHAGNDSFNPRVERSLAERALGFFIDIGEEKVQDPETGEWTIKTIRKYIPPDTTAIIFFLKNRMRHKYRDVQDLNHTGRVLQSSDELLWELRKDLIELQAEGVLTGVALPAPRKGKGN